jgi:oligopeptide transport system ATP-binding protein
MEEEVKKDVVEEKTIPAPAPQVQEEKPKEDIILSVKHLKMYFPISTGFFKHKDLKAVDDISFDIRRGETLGLVGESGCGKTTAGRAILYLYKPTSGEIDFNGKKVDPKDKKGFAEYRRKTNIVFQDPYSSLDPRMTISDIIGEPLDVNKAYKTKAERDARIKELMEKVGLNSEQANRYAHEFSGGQRQRIGIARSLAMNPEFLVCDEPVSALDVSIQAQVLNTFKDLQNELHLTYLFVAHNLLVVKHISDRIAVMYLGRIVELASDKEIFADPEHPYTVSLLSAIPVPDPKQARANKRIMLQGDIPSPLNAPTGCSFRTRCPFATAKCAAERPELVEVVKDHFVACHYPGIASGVNDSGKVSSPDKKEKEASKGQ